MVCVLFFLSLQCPSSHKRFLHCPSALPTNTPEPRRVTHTTSHQRPYQRRVLQVGWMLVVLISAGCLHVAKSAQPASSKNYSILFCHASKHFLHLVQCTHPSHSIHKLLDLPQFQHLRPTLLGRNDQIDDLGDIRVETIGRRDGRSTPLRTKDPSESRGVYFYSPFAELGVWGPGR